jgi:uncharacterized protein YbjT (DUF2867 family)
MAEQPILVTGAAPGSQGSTGWHIVQLLRERGVPVRAFVRTLDARSDELKSLGAEVVQGNLLDFASVQRAMAGIRRAFFTYPVEAGLLDATAIFAQAARKAGVELLVNVSQLRAREGTTSTPRQHQHWLSDEVFGWAGVGAIHLRAAAFYENLRALVGTSIARQDGMYLPWGQGDAVIPLIAGEDVARVAAGLLADPPASPSNAYYLIGELLTVDEIRDTFTDALARPISYHEITDEQWCKGAEARLNAHALEHLSHLWRGLRTRGTKKGEDDYIVTDAISILGGSAPKTLNEFIRENRDVFRLPQT